MQPASHACNYSVCYKEKSARRNLKRPGGRSLHSGGMAAGEEALDDPWRGRTRAGITGGALRSAPAPAYTLAELFTLSISSKAIGQHRQSRKDCPAVHPRLLWHRCHDLPGNPPAQGGKQVQHYTGTVWTQICILLRTLRSRSGEQTPLNPCDHACSMHTTI